MNQRFETPAAYLITPGNTSLENFKEKIIELTETIRLASAAGVSLVQIREKHLPARLVFDLAVAAVAAVSETAGKVLVNDRFDIAIAAGAHGVHISADSIPAATVRRCVPNGFIIGCSAHSLSAVLAAKDAGADFATFSPIFVTPEKGEPKGLDQLAMVCSSAGSFPVIALGGVSEANVARVIERGAAGAAAIRALHDKDSIEKFMVRLKSVSRVV